MRLIIIIALTYLSSAALSMLNVGLLGDLSSLYGWITLLESDELTKSQKHEIIFELANDADRMQKVADRFNKIGSAPELKEQRIEPLINQVLDYLEPRIPRE